jgi:hypothetical protein
VPNGNLSFMEYVWAPFVGLFWWFINRLTGKIDEIEKEKATTGDIDRLDTYAHDLDKRIDELGHTTVPRSEYKMDVSDLHGRVNLLEKSKQDRVTQIKIIEDGNGKNGDK